MHAANMDSAKGIHATKSLRRPRHFFPIDNLQFNSGKNGLRVVRGQEIQRARVQRDPMTAVRSRMRRLLQDFAPARRERGRR